MIYTVTLNPALDKTVTIPHFAVDQVNRVTSMRLDAGGKGINVSKWVQMLGGETVAMGILGGHTGGMIAASLEEMGIPADFVRVPEDTRTNLKIVDPDGHTNTDINEAGASVALETFQMVYDRLSTCIEPGDIVVLAGRMPPGAPEMLLPDWISELSERGAQVYLDVDGEALATGIEAGPYLIKPNDHELRALLGLPLATLGEIVSAARGLLTERTRRVAVSLGADGILLVQKDGILHGLGLDVPVGSTVGAGDATLAAIAYAHSRDMSPAETVTLAVAAGAASVMQSGTQVAPAELVHALRAQVTWRRL